MCPEFIILACHAGANIGTDALRCFDFLISLYFSIRFLKGGAIR